jgi:hypothetical protein
MFEAKAATYLDYEFVERDLKSLDRRKQYHAVVFVLDATDSSSVPTTSRELWSLMTDVHLNSLPFLILGNKCDLSTTMKSSVLQEQLGVKPPQLAEYKVKAEFFLCSVLHAQSLHQPLNWLMDRLETANPDVSPATKSLKHGPSRQNTASGFLDKQDKNDRRHASSSNLDKYKPSKTSHTRHTSAGSIPIAAPARQVTPPVVQIQEEEHEKPRDDAPTSRMRRNKKEKK